jgi:hypothetical protein
MVKSKGVYRVLVGKPEENRPLQDTSVGIKDSIKMDILEAGCGVWVGSIWLRIQTGGGHL